MELSRPVVDDLEALRTRLIGYCYRLLGSAADAEDAAQEALIRAATNWDRFDESRAGISTWVHRIATNVCLDMLRGAKRRELLIDVASVEHSGPGPGDRLPAYVWVEPMPGGRLIDAQDPADVAVARESVRLAFIAALQYLPPRQRAVLVLRDVLNFTAQECATILGTTVPSVTSALQRARSTLGERRREPSDLAEPLDPHQLKLLARYVAAFESHDVVELTAVLRQDAVASMPPFRWRLDGGPVIAAVAAASESCVGARLIPCDINGGPGFGQYRLDETNVSRPFALVAVDLMDGQIYRVVTFLGTANRFSEFGLPTRLGPGGPGLSDRTDDS
jgi:RNA polymerase sigma-70 factor (TIGR02960 family)